MPASSPSPSPPLPHDVTAIASYCPGKKELCHTAEAHSSYSLTGFAIQQHGELLFSTSLTLCNSFCTDGLKMLLYDNKINTELWPFKWEWLLCCCYHLETFSRGHRTRIQVFSKFPRSSICYTIPES